MNINIETAQALCEKYKRPINNYTFEYGEPGYSTSKKTILFGNWNDLPQYLLNALEKQFELEWGDEWLISDSGKAYRTQPNCYSWTPSYVMLNDGSVFGVDEIEDDDALMETYISELLNNPRRCAIVSNTALEQIKFKNMNGKFESGFYEVNDNPAEILENFQKKFPNHEFIFGNVSQEQFRINFEIWGRKKKTIKQQINDLFNKK